MVLIQAVMALYVTGPAHDPNTNYINALSKITVRIHQGQAFFFLLPEALASC